MAHEGGGRKDDATSRRSFMASAVAGAGAAVMTSCVTNCPPPRAKRPNVVLFISDDHDCFYTSCYGNEFLRTPNLDRLAREGMVFDRAFTPTAMCAPSRSALYTGLYPHRNGAHPNHSRVREGVRSLPQYLSAQGYRVALSGKRHVKPVESFPFQYLTEGVEGFLGQADAFLAQAGDQPFCLVVASKEPHTPHATGGYTPDEIEVSPNMVNTPETRQRVAVYCTDINLLDEEIGQVLASLDKHGLAEDTLFIYASDHGQPLPYGKWTCYESGLRVPFIVRWPGVVPAGTRTEAMVSFVDLVPTLLELAGGDAPNDLDGESFAAVLYDSRETHRELIFGTHTSEGIRNGGVYPIRSVRDERYKYIVNVTPENTFTNNVTHNGEVFGPLWDSWNEKAKHDAAAAQRTHFYQHRPAEEFYDLQADPFELNNLAGDPAYNARIESLRRALLGWMEQQNDPRLADVKGLLA